MDKTGDKIASCTIFAAKMTSTQNFKWLLNFSSPVFRWLWSVRYLHSSIVSTIIDGKKEHNDIDNMWRAHTPIIPAGRNICTAFSHLHASHHHSDLIFTPTMSQTSLAQGSPFLNEFAISSTSSNHVKMAICCPQGRGTLRQELLWGHYVVPKLSPSCPKALLKMSPSCLKVVPNKLSQSCVKVVSKLSQSLFKVLSKLCQNCLKVVSRFVKVVAKLSQSCLKVDPKLSPSCAQFVPSSSQLVPKA